jgi:hypothetical protein
MAGMALKSPDNAAACGLATLLLCAEFQKKLAGTGGYFGEELGGWREP